MPSAARCQIIALVLFAICGTSFSLKVAAFNVKTFVPGKVDKAAIRHIIAKIVMRYDLILIQEIRGNGPYVMATLQQEITDQGGRYGYVHSEKLGRTTYTEYYVYFYKESTVDILEVYQYDDGPDDGTDPFEREPYAVHIHPKTEPELNNFTILGIHVRPSQAPEELQELFHAYETVVTHFDNNENVLVIGDLNADCRYLTSTERQNLYLSANSFQWLVRDDDDTTLSSTHCAYDRIIVSGNKLQEAVVKGQSHIFLFDDFYDLTSEEAKDVSDHYPVDVELLP